MTSRETSAEQSYATSIAVVCCTASTLALIPSITIPRGWPQVGFEMGGLLWGLFYLGGAVSAIVGLVAALVARRAQHAAPQHPQRVALLCSALLVAYGATLLLLG